MRRLSLKDIIEDTKEEEESIHSFGEMWVVECSDGYWQTKKDCEGNLVWYPANPVYVTIINTRQDPRAKIEREEEKDRRLENPIEYINMRDYTGQGFVGMEGAFDTSSIHDGFDID